MNIPHTSGEDAALIDYLNTHLIEKEIDFITNNLESKISQKLIFAGVDKYGLITAHVKGTKATIILRVSSITHLMLSGEKQGNRIFLQGHGIHEN